MVPPLTKSAGDRQKWQQLIDRVKQLYRDDARVEVKTHGILFKAGEDPRLPIRGHKLLRFSAKITGPMAASEKVEEYLDTVTDLAREMFGSRVQRWNELFEVYGVYGWREVNDSIETYEHVRCPTKASERDLTVDIG